MPTSTLLLAAMFAGAVLLIAYALAGRRVDVVQTRLSQIGVTQARNLEEFELREPFADRTLRPLVGALARAASRFTSVSFATRTAKRLAMAGNVGEFEVAEWLGLKVLVAIIAGIATFLLLLIMQTALTFTLVVGFGVAGIAYVLPEFWLSSRIRRRQRQILRSLPDALDLLTISVRAGLGFDAALAKVVEKTHGPLAEEFRRALAELRIGRTRRDSLRDIIPRTEVQALNAFIGAILQAEQLGVSISKVLQVQSEQLRILRRQRAEEMAAKAPIKMLFPLVGCIFPSLFIVILGPAVILLVQNFQ
jgi:tight adherence protein C